MSELEEKLYNEFIAGIESYGKYLDKFRNCLRQFLSFLNRGEVLRELQSLADKLASNGIDIVIHEFFQEARLRIIPHSSSLSVSAGKGSNLPVMYLVFKLMDNSIMVRLVPKDGKYDIELTRLDVGALDLLKKYDFENMLKNLALRLGQVISLVRCF
ncbi:MAG: hypothetical protein GXO26_02905 [Crenarchaeota archaeon]|nr:hypothetical protein [Thermoproteota archaeon]